MTRNTIIFLFLSFNIFSQNLIKNPSFESISTDCVRKISRLGNSVEYWDTANFGTTDVFSSCANNHVGVPKNYNGFQEAKHGYNYAGCYFYSKDNRNYREYIQGELKTTLEKGKKYEVAFYISLADVSDYAIKNIDFYFSNRNVIAGTLDAISINRMSRYRDFILHFYKIENEEFYRNKNSWIKLSKVITAKGYENNITIGNFEKDSEISKVKIKRKDQKVSYYYIDLVSVIEVEDEVVIKNTKPIDSSVALKKDTAFVKKEKIATQIDPTVFKLNKAYIFKNVVFDFNSAILKAEAKSEIENIHAYLLNNQNTKIEILGHTDNVGLPGFNQKLSERRAKSVMEYFIYLGLDSSKITFIGYGEEKPIFTNDTEENRDNNRRVEFKFSQE